MKQSECDAKYSFKLSEWEEILGFLVPEYLVQKFGLETLMAAILYEMTWFGFSAEDIHKYRGDTAKALDSIKEEKNENINT